MVQVPTTKMVVLELIQRKVQIPKWMQWKVVLYVKRGMIMQKNKLKTKIISMGLVKEE
jgi:hypothetical protein